jgi:hypothetical protein
MDDFPLDRPELSGSLISMEFGQGGRVQQLWGADPNLPENSEEFQFVLPPVSLGEEFSEDYNPGTILIGARLSPDDPWIVSRNAEADVVGDPEDPSVVEFRYEFGLLPEIVASGKFYEIPGPIPQIAWDLSIANGGRQPIEIGELAFPLALNNLYEGHSRTVEGTKELLLDRLYVHKYIGGCASYVFAQRMTADPPALLITPGEDTRWEFFNHVPASLNTPYRWEGIPVVYAHSRAAIEREGWPEWFNGHTSIVLEPDEERVYAMRFIPAVRGGFDGVHHTLTALRRPSLKLFPSAVAPFDVGIAIEVTGATPTNFNSTADTELETDSDEEGGFCYLRPDQPGVVRVSFEDSDNRESDCHLLFTEPLEDLIRVRAEYIIKHQIHDDPNSNLHRAILPANIGEDERITEPEEYMIPFGVESSLSDALFLAEKNTIFPVRDEIRVLDDYLSEFVQDDLQNPGDGSVGSTFADSNSIAINLGRAEVYGLVFNLFHTLYRVAKGYGETKQSPEQYLDRAARTAISMFRNASPSYLRSVGVPVLPYMSELIADLRREGKDAAADELERHQHNRSEHLVYRSSPGFGDSNWNVSVFSDVFASARRLDNDARQEQAIRLAYAARSLSPNWWWYGSDKRWLDDSDSPHPAMVDKGEMCLGPSGPANSMMLLQTLDRDYGQMSEGLLRLAFGGMIGVFALIRSDGGASMAFCPDAASRQYGTSALTGDIGQSLFHYLQGASSYVLPGRGGVTTFGCRLESSTKRGSESFVVRPWDGVGRRIVVRQLGLEATVRYGRILEFSFDARKRWAEFVIDNPSDKDMTARLELRGLWGSRFDVGGIEAQSEGGILETAIALPASKEVRTEIRVIE